MPIRLGSLNIENIRLGNQPVTKGFLGQQQVFGGNCNYMFEGQFPNGYNAVTVAAGSELGFVALSHHYDVTPNTYKVYTSTNGVSWTPATIGPTSSGVSATVTDLCYVPGLDAFIAVGNVGARTEEQRTVIGHTLQIPIWVFGHDLDVFGA